MNVNQNTYVLSESNQYLLKVIGDTGVSRNQDIRDFLKNDEKGKDYFQKENKISVQLVAEEMNFLKNSPFLDSETVKLGARGGYNYSVFGLSKTGKVWYQVLTGKNPVLSQKERFIQQYQSAYCSPFAAFVKGYIINDCLPHLTAMGYGYTYQTNHPNVDMILQKENRNYYTCFETEMSTKEEFYGKMDVLYHTLKNQSVQHFAFVSPNLVASSLLQEKVMSWLKNNFSNGNTFDTAPSCTVSPPSNALESIFLHQTDKYFASLQGIEKGTSFHFTTFGQILNQEEFPWFTFSF